MMRAWSRRLMAGVASLVAVSAAAAGSPEKGRTAFVEHGCWQCHGYEGQGSVAGVRIAPSPMALEAMSAFVRNTRGSMPPYPKAILSEEDLGDIHAYLASLPPTRDPKSIPLLER